MSVTTRLVWTFRCDRCQHHATFGHPGVYGEEHAAPSLAEMIQTLRLDGWVIEPDLGIIDVLILPSDHKIVCPMHTDTLVDPETQES